MEEEEAPKTWQGFAHSLKTSSCTTQHAPNIAQGFLTARIDAHKTISTPNGQKLPTALKYHPVQTHAPQTAIHCSEKTLTPNTDTSTKNMTTAIQNSAAQLNTYEQAVKSRHRQDCTVPSDCAQSSTTFP